MERSAAHLRWLHWTLLTGFALALAGPSLSPADDDAAAPEKAAPEKTTPAEKPGDTKPSDAKPAPAAAEQAPADDQAPAEDESSNPDSSATPKPKLVPLRLAGGRAAPVRADLDPVFQDRVDQLIHQLGDSSFAVRQRASKQLVDIGIAGQPLLSEALADEDAEVRNRSAQVLTKVVEADFRARLEAFANDPLGKQEHSLPSWSRFRETFGADKVARDLFVDMQRAEPMLLDLLESNPKLAGEMLVLRMQSILQTIQWPQLNGGAASVVPLGTICALLFVSATDGAVINDQDAIQLYNLIHQGSFQTSLRTTANGPLLKKLLGIWILQNSAPSIAYMNLQLAFNCDLKEGLDLAIKLIGNDAGGQPFMRQYVILAFARFGNHEHIPLIEPLLKDATPCMPQQNPDPKASQIRDVALAVLVKLSGQELKDYGLEHIQANPQTVFQPGTVTFNDPAKRDAALKKWKEWAQQRPVAKE